MVIAHEYMRFEPEVNRVRRAEACSLLYDLPSPIDDHPDMDNPDDLSRR